MGVENAQIDQQGRQQQGRGGERGEDGRVEGGGNQCAAERAHGPEQAHGQTQAAQHVAFAEMAVRAGKRGKGHGRQGRAQGRMDGHVKTHGEQGDHDPRAARAHKADHRSQQKHGRENKHGILRAEKTPPGGVGMQ